MNIIDESARYGFTHTKWACGESYYKQGRVDIKSVEEVEMEMFDSTSYMVSAHITGKQNDYRTSIVVNERHVVQAECSCPDYRAHKFYYNMEYCKHIAATTIAFIDYAKHYKLRTTNRAISQMIKQYEGHEIAKSIMLNEKELVTIEPKLEIVDGKAYASFSIGKSKLYVMQNMQHFYEAMQQGAELTYGKDLKILHDMNVFSKQGEAFARFIMEQVKERNFYLDQLSQYTRTSASIKKAILLNARAMDEFYQLITQYGCTITEVNEFTGKKKQVPLSCIKGSPKICLHVIPEEEDDEMEEVRLSCEQMEYVEGAEHGYLLQGTALYELETSYRDKMEPFIKTMLSGEEIVIGKEQVPAFYKQVVRNVKEFVDVVEEKKELIEEIIPDEPEFVAYFDYVNKNIVCRAEVSYGTKSYLIMDEEEKRDGIRDVPKELYVQTALNNFLPYYDDQLKVLHCGMEEDRIFDLLDHGLGELMEYTAVEVSDTIKRLKVQKSPKVSVGVSVENNLLNLDFNSDDFDFAELKGILASYRIKKTYHRLKNGNFLRLEENSVELLSELIEGMHLTVEQLKEGTVKVPAFRALYLDKVLQDSEGVAYTRDRYFKGMLRNFKAVGDADYEVPEELKNVLRTYQKNGYRWLRMIEEYGFGGILADDMGLGKTIQVLSLLLAAKEEGKSGTTLIVCPASLVYNWEEECKKFAPSLKVATVTGNMEKRKSLIERYFAYDVLVTSYDLIKRDIVEYKDITFAYQIIDEAQYIKNHTTQGAKAVKLIRAKTKYALTGTPIENRLSELWSIFDYLMPGFLYKYEEFRKDFEIPIAKLKDEEVVHRLKRMIQPFILRRIKKDVLKDLPDKMEEVVYAKFENEQQKLYDSYVLKVKESLAKQDHSDFEKNKIKILADLTRLRQICCDPNLCYENYRGESAKLFTCLELIETAVENGHKILLFSQFTSMLAILKEELQKKGISHYEITGATSKEKRMQLVNQFNGDDTNVFLISLKAGGTGLNLTAADIVIHYDPWWNIAAQNQATDRAHRIGQRNVVTVFKLIAKGTIEEKILQMQQEKQNLADQIISGEMNQLSSLNREDLLQLLSN
ncbi:MAG: DEAD/DEAH box helicase [bacterium]|nr:DEAD/DEAH box helicase [bacterium]